VNITAGRVRMLSFPSELFIAPRQLQLLQKFVHVKTSFCTYAGAADVSQ
jgi:hypothetical protein